jgi:hypothetical protein
VRTWIGYIWLRTESGGRRCEVGFQVLTVSTKMAAFWVVASCGLVESVQYSKVLA